MGDINRPYYNVIGFNNFEFDHFIGRKISNLTLDRSRQLIIDQPSEKFIHSWISSEDKFGKGFPAFKLEDIFEALCRVVNEGERVLLSKSPGSISLGRFWCDESFYKQEIVYEPFTKDQFDKLEKMYELRKDLKKFSNPFSYQPE